MDAGKDCGQYPLKIPVYPGFCNQLPDLLFKQFTVSSKTV